MFWIDKPGMGRLAIAARPRSGDWLQDELTRWREDGVDHVISLLEPHEVHDLGLGAEAAACARAGMTFSTLPIPDRGVPASVVKVRELVSECGSHLRAGHSIVIHCRAGIGRSATIAACVLVAVGDAPQAALERLAATRGVPVPDTPAQVDWVESFTPA